jgi:hypothetical protein
MFSQQESLKRLQKPLKNKKGKIIKKNGKPIMRDLWVPDYAKNDVTKMSFRTSDKDNPNIPQEEEVTIFTRKCKPAKQVINMTEAAYLGMVTKEAPYGYRGKASWTSLTKNQRIKWHCEQIAAQLGGTFDSFQVLD